MKALDEGIQAHLPGLAELLVKYVARDMGETIPAAECAAIASDVLQDIRLEVKQTLNRAVTIEDFRLSDRRAEHLSQ